MIRGLSCQCSSWPASHFRLFRICLFPLPLGKGEERSAIMKAILRYGAALFFFTCLLWPPLLNAQPKSLKELAVSYPLGGSSSYFWTAYRAGSFEKHGLKINPVFIPGGVTALQALMAKELFIELTAGPAAIRAWARGGKEITFVGAVGNRLDYVLVVVSSVRNAEELRGKRVGVSQLGASPDFIARLGLRQMGLNPERDVTIVPIGSPGERWAAERRSRPRFALPTSVYASRPQSGVRDLA